jgi:hypothetical protein
MDLEKKLETIQGCLKKTNNQTDFEQCIQPMTMTDARGALEELQTMLVDEKDLEGE